MPVRGGPHYTPDPGTGGGGTPGTASVSFDPSATFPVRMSVTPNIDQFVELVPFQIALMQNLDTLQMPIDPIDVGVSAYIDILADIINPDGIVTAASIDNFQIIDNSTGLVIAPTVDSIAIPIDVVNGANLAALADIAIDTLGLDTITVSELVDSIQVNVSPNSIGITQAVIVVFDYTVAGSYTFVSPITGTIIGECWGSGAGGARCQSVNGGGGGGAGAYSKTPNYAVTAGNSYSVVVPAGGIADSGGGAGAGADATFDTTGIVAKGGGVGTAGQTGAQGTGGTGGAAASGTGTTKNSGGNGGGGGGLQANGGGGGGSGGDTSGGGTGNANRTAGTAGTTNGATGGTGAAASTTPGTAGNFPGAGGGGGALIEIGGAGANGRVRLTVVLV